MHCSYFWHSETHHFIKIFLTRNDFGLTGFILGIISSAICNEFSTYGTQETILFLKKWDIVTFRWEILMEDSNRHRCFEMFVTTTFPASEHSSRRSQNPIPLSLTCLLSNFNCRPNSYRPMQINWTTTNHSFPFSPFEVPLLLDILMLKSEDNKMCVHVDTSS